VQIGYRKRRFYGAQARNLSVQGMYLTVRNVTLPVGTPVELEMECLGKEWLVEAVVVHGTRSGVGVMFREPQPELYQGLIQPDALRRPPPARDAHQTQLSRS
jgi:hypothetical protein